MAIAQSKPTSQGQISVPAEVRRRLGLVPGSVLEWDDEDGTVVVRRVGQFSSADIHTALFAGDAPQPHSLRQDQPESEDEDALGRLAVVTSREGAQVPRFL